MRKRLVQWLIETGYQEEILVEAKGEFALRGAVVDIFSPQEKNPMRLEFDGDQLVDLRYFDPATQTSLREKGLKKLTLIPAGEILFEEQLCREACRRLKEFSDSLELPATHRREIADKINSKRKFPGIETLIPAFYEEEATLFDYLPEETFLLIDNKEAFALAAKNFGVETDALFKQTGGLERVIPPKALLNPLESLWKKLDSFPLLLLRLLPTLEEGGIPLKRVDIAGSEKLRQEWSPLSLRQWVGEGFHLELVCHTPVQATRLNDLLKGEGLGSLPIKIGRLSQGFCWPEEKIAVLTEEEIFGHKVIRRTKPPAPLPDFSSFSELKEGDILVHEEYGLNRYLGLKHLNIQGVAGDFLLLEFLGGDKVYLPIYRLNAVGRYIGGGEGVALDSLGGVRWQKLKKRARQEIYQVARELMRVEAERTLHSGTSFPPPDTLDEEFASHFPYDETLDQDQAIRDVLNDMQGEKPMDRLICGDVGYGKTEVAMRAAFKAVNGGKQVAFLVPTTILALQHFETFQARFSKSPIAVEMLSRFRTKREQKETLKKIEEGRLDIVIGTHRLLAKDMRFKDLGLLILDEEHRFGVRHKERIKQLRPTVDVLTLSATPIPRTLHMSLIGLKDLSLIHTPPVDRIAVRTYIARWDDAVIHQAVSKELSRKGQVFFVHNRVESIESVYQNLSKLFPETRIAIAHGQMKEEDLEKVMIDFLHQKTEILLTTTIIESGIDVPTANTMLINRADTLGLAQLYQLRGRVGRSDRQAYCYLLIPDEEILTKDSRRRLEALTKYTELGAGFQIAQHDLEIRGAGNLLGTSQSGFIEEIGYEMYTKLLARAVRQLKGEKTEEEILPEIQLKIEAFIPETYMKDPSLRMELYKRMSHLNPLEKIPILREEIQDRFGLLPQPLLNLFEIIEIKLLALPLRLKSLKFDGQHLVLDFDPSTPLTGKTLVDRALKSPRRYQMKPSGKFFVRLQGQPKEPLAIAEESKKILRDFLKEINS